MTGDKNGDFDVANAISGVEVRWLGLLTYVGERLWSVHMSYRNNQKKINSLQKTRNVEHLLFHE